MSDVPEMTEEQQQALMEHCSHIYDWLAQIVSMYVYYIRDVPNEQELAEIMRQVYGMDDFQKQYLMTLLMNSVIAQNLEIHNLLGKFKFQSTNEESRGGYL